LEIVNLAPGAVTVESIKQQLQHGNFSLDEYLQKQEGAFIATALELATGNISEAAKLLGINRTTLHSRISAHEKNHE
jgi:transcriptional regulator of acetoin/glycerol metabolism